MALVIADFIAESANAPGTGTINLGGKLTGRRTFVDAVGDGNETFYYITDGSQAEWGLGTVTAGSPSNTLSRDTVLGNTATSRGGTPGKLTFSGSVTVYGEIPTDHVVWIDNNGALNAGGNKRIQLSKGADIASASALTLGTDGNYFDVTGTTSITSIDAVGVGTVVALHFDAALTLTHHASNLILPGGADITTAAGDEFTFVEYASGQWRCIGYALASGETASSSSISSTFRNRIINGGAPFVNQRGDQTPLASAGDYFADRWAGYGAGTSAVNAQVGTSGGEDWLELEVTTAEASLAAGSYMFYSQRIEANNITDFKLGTANAKQVTLSFKHKHSKAGTYCVAFHAASSARTYVAEYTQSVADTEETATITLTLDTSGTWASGTSNGLEVIFTMASGSTYQGAADTWSGTNYLATANQVNALDTVGNKFRVRDVQLELGSVATPFERRTYGVELALCQRYYEKSYDQSEVPGSTVISGSVIARASGSSVSLDCKFRVSKRTAATVTFYAPSSGTAGSIRNTSTNADASAAAAWQGESGFVIDANGTATDGQQYAAQWAADAEL